VARKEITVKKYVVKLSDEEREKLHKLTRMAWRRCSIVFYSALRPQTASYMSVSTSISSMPT